MEEDSISHCSFKAVMSPWLPRRISIVPFCDIVRESCNRLLSFISVFFGANIKALSFFLELDYCSAVFLSGSVSAIRVFKVKSGGEERKELTGSWMKGSGRFVGRTAYSVCQVMRSNEQ